MITWVITNTVHPRFASGDTENQMIIWVNLTGVPTAHTENQVTIWVISNKRACGTPRDLNNKTRLASPATNTGSLKTKTLQVVSYKRSPHGEQRDLNDKNPKTKPVLLRCDAHRDSTDNLGQASTAHLASLR